MIPEYYIEVLHWGTNLVLLNLGIKLGTLLQLLSQSELSIAFFMRLKGRQYSCSR